MSSNTADRLPALFARLAEKYSGYLPSFAMAEFAHLIDDALTTHPFLIRLVEAVHDPDATIHALEATFSGAPVAASYAPGEPTAAARRIRERSDLTPEQRARIESAPDLVDALVERFCVRAGPEGADADFLARGDAGLVRAAQVFVPGDDDPFACFAWGHVHQAMHEALPEMPWRRDAKTKRALESALADGYLLLGSDELLDDNDEPEPIGIAPFEQLERYVDRTMMGMLLAFTFSGTRGRLRLVPGERGPE